MDKEAQKKSYFGITEISEKLGVSQKLIRRHIASGALKSTKIGGVYKILTKSLEDFISTIDEIKEQISTSDVSQEKGFSLKLKSTNNYKNNSKDDVNWVDIIGD